MEDFKEVSEQDYKNLEGKFRTLLEETGSFVLENPDLKETLDNFIISVGEATKELLQKYAKMDYVKGLEVEEYQVQMMGMKRKMVKMRLSIKQVSNSISAFNNISKS